MQTDPAHLLKLRLVVARYGEMDGACWWNTNGVLSRTGRSVFSRGFPFSHSFAQARVACAVAAARCEAVFAPPGCLTLWNLPAEAEDRIAASWSRWCRNPEEWTEFFAGIEALPSSDLAEQLLQLGLISDATLAAVKPLRRSAEGKAVPLPGTGTADTPTLMLLAAAFSKGERLKPAVPYIRLAE